MTSSQKATQSVCWLRNLNFSLETHWILTTSQWILAISWISTAKCRFRVNLRYKSENLNKFWKFKNPRWRPLVLPWKPIRHHVVSLNWKYKWSLLYVPNFNCVESRTAWGDPIDPPPPLSLKASCNYLIFNFYNSHIIVLYIYWQS